MKNAVGIIFTVIALAITTLIILEIWGVHVISLLFAGRMLVTFLVLGISLLFFIAIYAIFFWGGNKGPAPRERMFKKQDFHNTDN